MINRKIDQTQNKKSINIESIFLRKYYSRKYINNNKNIINNL